MMKLHSEISGSESRATRIDSRVSILCFLIYAISLASIPKYNLAAALAFLGIPVFVIMTGAVPAKTIARRTLMLSPFLAFAASGNILFDVPHIVAIGPMRTSGGVISSAVIFVKGLGFVAGGLVVGTAMEFDRLCSGLGRLGVPSILTTQLLLMHRYVFVLMAEAQSMKRARDLRSYGRKGMGLRVAGAILGVLLVRTLNRSERIYRAMTARGFSGQLHDYRTSRLETKDYLLLTTVIVLSIAFRFGFS